MNSQEFEQQVIEIDRKYQEQELDAAEAMEDLHDLIEYKGRTRLEDE